jgi:CRP/FNR family transcriptional regulator, anaerobic regulatory protein
LKHCLPHIGIPHGSSRLPRFTDVVLVAYSQRQVAQLSEERGSVRARFLTLLSQHICVMQDHLMLLGRQSAKERIASFLLLLSERTGSEDDNLLDVPMSRLDIADYLGLRIETVSRVLSEMDKTRVIDMLDMHQFALLENETLQSLANGDE